MPQDYGLQTTTPFCDRLETRNFTNNATSEGLITTQGINATFDAFMVAIGEVDYYALFGEDDGNDVSDTVRLFFRCPHTLNWTQPVLLVLVDVAILFRAWVLPGRGPKQSSEHRADIFHDRRATVLV